MSARVYCSSARTQDDTNIRGVFNESQNLAPLSVKKETKRRTVILSDSDLSPDKRRTRKSHWTSGGIRYPWSTKKKEKLGWPGMCRGVGHGNAAVGVDKAWGPYVVILFGFENRAVFLRNIIL